MIILNKKKRYKLELNEYKLRRWSRLIKVRDKGLCFMCQENDNIFQMNSHHLYPKKDPRYAYKAYDLANGICLCWRCHRQVVHSTWTNWRKFCVMFKAYMRRKAITEFNDKNELV